MSQAVRIGVCVFGTSHQVLVRHLVLVIVVSCIQVVVVPSVVARVMRLCSHSFVVAAMAAARRAAAIYIAVVLPDICIIHNLRYNGAVVTHTIVLDINTVAN